MFDDPACEFCKHFEAIRGDWETGFCRRESQMAVVTCYDYCPHFVDIQSENVVKKTWEKASGPAPTG